MASTKVHTEYGNAPKAVPGNGDPMTDMIKESLGETLSVVPTYQSDLDMKTELGHTTTGLKYAIRGRARVIEQSVGRRLASFQDPIKSVLPVTVVDAHRVIVTTKEVVGGRSIIAPERAPARTVGVKETSREVVLERYGGDLEMNLNLQHEPDKFKEELRLKVEAQQAELERVLIEIGYDTCLREGLQLPTAIMRSNPAFDPLATGKKRDALYADTTRIYSQNCFAVLNKSPFPLQSILCAAKYATAYTIGAPGSVLILPHGVPEMLRYTKPERMQFRISGLKTSDNQPITMDLGEAHTDPATNIKMMVHIPMPTYEHGTAMPRVGMGCLSRVVTVYTYYLVPSTISTFHNNDYEPMLGVGNGTEGAPDFKVTGGVAIAGSLQMAQAFAASSFDIMTRQQIGIEPKLQNFGAEVQMTGIFPVQHPMFTMAGDLPFATAGNNINIAGPLDCTELKTQAAAGDTKINAAQALAGMSAFANADDRDKSTRAIQKGILNAGMRASQYKPRAYGHLQEGIDEPEIFSIVNSANVFSNNEANYALLDASRRQAVPWMFSSIKGSVTPSDEEVAGWTAKFTEHNEPTGEFRNTIANKGDVLRATVAGILNTAAGTGADISDVKEPMAVAAVGDADSFKGALTFDTNVGDSNKYPFHVEGCSRPGAFAKSRMVTSNMAIHGSTKFEANSMSDKQSPYTTDHLKTSYDDIDNSGRDAKEVLVNLDNTENNIKGFPSAGSQPPARRYTKVANLVTRGMEQIVSNTGDAQLVVRKTRLVMSSGLLAAPGASTGELLVGMPQTGVSTSQTDESLKMQLRVYMGAVLKQPESVIVLPDISADGIVGQTRYPTRQEQEQNGTFDAWVDSETTSHDYIVNLPSILDMSPRTNIQVTKAASEGTSIESVNASYLEALRQGIQSKIDVHQAANYNIVGNTGKVPTGYEETAMPGTPADMNVAESTNGTKEAQSLADFNPTWKSARLAGLPLLKKRTREVLLNDDVPYAIGVTYKETDAECSYGDKVMEVDGDVHDVPEQPCAEEDLSILRLVNQRSTQFRYGGVSVSQGTFEIHYDSKDGYGTEPVKYQNLGQLGELDSVEGAKYLSGSFMYKGGNIE